MPTKKPETATAAPTGTRQAANLNSRRFYINRELSMLEFNGRVLEEARDTRHPLLERVKFLAIFANNTDEFFMIRVSGLRRQLVGGVLEAPPDGMTPAEQMTAIRRRLLPFLAQQIECWRDDLAPKLRAADIHVLNYSELKGKQRKLLRRYFEREIFPVLTPLASDPAHPFPHISNLSLNLAVLVIDPQWGERFARLKVPDIFPRLLPIPTEEKADSYERLGLGEAKFNHFIWLEEVIAANLDLLFPGLEIAAAYSFRLTRDADMEIQEDEASDLLSTVEDSVDQRFFGSVVRLEVDAAMPERIRKLLVENLGNLAPYQVYAVERPLGMSCLMELLRVDRPDLKDLPFLPAMPRALARGENIFRVIQRHDLLLYHPYDSFLPVVDFVREAARDPNVLAIKQTLYRVGSNSPIVDALMEARENGKQVAVLVELKARFDEENNIVWARALERAGVHVVYGLMGLKTHAKVCLVVRREPHGIVRYVHFSTGNYNVSTARVYADLGYFTCDPDLASDAADLFNALTGYSRKQEYRKLLVAPSGLRQGILDRIQREIDRHQQHGDGYLAFKLNALVDPACIVALYRASQAGVKVDLQVRSTCCLRPGLKGVSENITVTSIVGRFLEHARIYYFHNGGEDEVLMGSADLMQRNLDRRVELLFPVQDPRLRAMIRDSILGIHLKDNVKARRLLPNGNYELLTVKSGEAAINSQLWMLEHKGLWHWED